MTNKIVIDTNVAIVANGTGDGFEKISPACRLAAIELLRRVLKDGIIVVDLQGECQAEYHRHLNPRGQPGVGDLFYREIIQSHPGRIMRISLEKDGEGQYVNLPREVISSKFDQSDRKFAALGFSCGCQVANATDRDWLEWRHILEAAGLNILFVCSDECANWFVNS